MTTQFNRTRDAGLQLVEKIIDQSDGPIDERTFFILDKMLSKAQGRARPSKDDESSAPSPPSNQPSRESSNGGQASSDSLIATLARTRVRPGDLITAGYMDSLVDALLELNRRLTALEKAASSATPVVVPPPAPPPPKDTPTVPPPVIVSAIASTVRGVGVQIDVRGKGLAEGLLQAVKVAGNNIDIGGKGFKFTTGGFLCTVTTKNLQVAKNEIFVRTKGGEDVALVTIDRDKSPFLVVGNTAQKPSIKTAIATLQRNGQLQIKVTGENISADNIKSISIGAFALQITSANASFVGNSLTFSVPTSALDLTDKRMTLVTTGGTAEAVVSELA